jgi:hypothetical protein
MGTCPGCGTSNPEDSKFCAACGKQLPEKEAIATHCSQCGTTNPPGSAFCGSCGTSLTAGAGSEPPTTPPKTPPIVRAVTENPCGQLRTVLRIGGGIFILSAFAGCARMSMMQSMYGMWANTGLLSIFLVLDFILGGMCLFAAERAGKGDTPLATIMLWVMGGFGVLDILAGLGSGNFVTALIGAALLGAALFGRKQLVTGKAWP